MNSKSTLALVVLAAAAGVWLWKGDEWGPKLGLKPTHAEPPPSQSATILNSITPESLTRIEVAFPTGDPLVLERSSAESSWKLPGNWPLRKAEVEELIQVLGNLRTRFQAIPLADANDATKYGLATTQKPLVVKLAAGGKSETLTFGNPEPADGETTFTRPAFVRIDDLPEVLQLGPQVVPVVHRPADAYRRRQLFADVERVKVSAANPVPNPLAPQASSEIPVSITIPGEDTASIQVSRPTMKFFGAPIPKLEGNFTLTRIGKLPEPAIYSKGAEPTVPPERLAETWELSAPVRDRLEPTRLRSLLVAISEMWVDEFVNPSEDEKANFDAKTGLAESKQAISVKQKRSEPVTVRFGKVAKTGERTEMITLPGGPPGTPPQSIPRKIPFEFRYAKLDGNPQIFIVSAEKFSELFPSATQLTDPQVMRYSADEIQEITVRHVGTSEVKLKRKKGNPKATDLNETQDRWFLDARPNPLVADAARVSELLGLIAGFRSEKQDDISYPSSPPELETLVSLSVREKRAEGEPEAPTQKVDLRIGKPDGAKRLLPVQLAGWPRVTRVSDKLGPDDPDSWVGSLLFPKTVSGLLARSPLAYRGRKLFDTSDATLNSVTVTAASGGFALAKNATSGEWKLTAPLSSDADPGKATQLATALSGLEATEYLADDPKPEALKEFGLEKPAQTVSLAFTGGRQYKLELGAPRPGKAEVFARLDGGGVFGLASTVAEQVTSGVIGLLPLKIWATQPDKVTGLEIARTGDDAKNSYTLAKDGTNWKLTGPFAAPVTYLNAQPLLTTLGALQAVKYQAMAAANPGEFGLDKPFLTLKLSFQEKKPNAPGTSGKEEEHAVAKTLLIGGLTPDGGNRFAALSGPNEPVFVVPTAYLFAAQTPPLDLLDRTLLFLDAGQVAKVRIALAKPEDGFAIARGDKGKWAVEGSSFAVDDERIGQLTGTVRALPVIRLAAYGDAVKWADFGLEKPAATITVTLTGEKPILHTIALGNIDPAGKQFVRVDEGKAVGEIGAVASTNLTRGKFDYADRTLLTFEPTGLTGLIRKEGKEELELAPSAALGWDVVKPAKFKADQPFVEELAELLGRLRAQKVAAFGKKEDVFKQYGLEPPAAVLTLTVGDKAEQKSLRLGKPVEPTKPEGDRYAAVESTAPDAIVGVLPAALASKLLTPAVGFRDHTLAKYVDADKVTLDRGDRKISFAKMGLSWKVVEPLTAPAESAELESLVADLGKLRVDTWVGPKSGDLKSYGLDKPEAKWLIFDGDKPVLTLSIGKRSPDGRVYATADKSELVGLLDPVLSGRVLAEYRQRKPWEVDAAQVEGVEIARGNSKFELHKAGPLWIDSAKATEQIDVRVVNELLGTLGALKVDRYVVDKNADPKLYGLENPEMRVTVTSQGQNSPKRTLEIGAVVGGTDGKQRYARIVDKDRSDAFVLTALDTMRLTRERAEFLMKKP